MKCFSCLALGCYLLFAIELCGAAEKWTKVSSPHCTIFTTGSAATAREWVAGLEAFRLSLNELAPTDERLLEPMTMVIFDRLKTYEAVVPRQVKDEKPNRTPLSNFAHRNGLFLGAVNGEADVPAQHSIYFQAGAWLTNSYGRPLPLWLAVGLQEVYAKSDLSDGRMTIGYSDERNARRMKSAKLLPLEQLLGMTTAGETYQSKPGPFNAQAWSLVHYLMLGEKGANRPKLARFMNSLTAGHSEEEALREAFPEGLEALAKNASRYARRGVYYVETLPFDLRHIERGMRTVPATEAEVQLIHGYLYLCFQNAEVAAPYFERALALAPTDAANLEAMGALALARNNEPESRRRYQEAVAAGSTSYVAHFRAVYPAVVALYGNEAVADSVDQASARATMDSLEQVLRLHPGYRPAHAFLGGVAGSLTTMTIRDGKLLSEGVERFPDDARMAAGMAAFEIATKQYSQAKARLDQILDGKQPNAGDVKNYTHKLYARMLALNDLHWFEHHAKEQNTETAAKIMARLDGVRLLPAERARFTELRAAIMTRGTLKRVSELIAQQNWSLANILLDNLEAGDAAGILREDIAKLREQARPKNEKAPAEAGAGN